MDRNPAFTVHATAHASEQR